MMLLRSEPRLLHNRQLLILTERARIIDLSEQVVSTDEISYMHIVLPL